jgi:hypothetical protein
MKDKMRLDISVFGNDTDELIDHLTAILRHLAYKPAGIDFYTAPAVEGHKLPVHMGVTKSGKRPRKVGTIKAEVKD